MKQRFLKSFSLAALVLWGVVLFSPLVYAASSLLLAPNHGQVTQTFKATYSLPSVGRCSTPYITFSWDGMGPRSGALLTTVPCASPSVTVILTPPAGSGVGPHTVYGFFSNSTGGNANIDSAQAPYTVDVTPTPTPTPLPPPPPTPTPTPPPPPPSANVPPTVVTLAATDITPYSAHLNGTVDPRGCSLTGGGVSWSFIVGTTLNYGLTAPSGGINPKLNAPTLVGGVMTGLTPNTLYHFELTAFGPCDGGNGTDMTFTTLVSLIPDLTVTTLGAIDISDHTATLTGTVNPHGCDAQAPGGGTWSFILGTTKSYGLAGPLGVFDPHSSSDVKVSGPAINLTPNTLYHYQLTAFGLCGTGDGTDMTFTTSDTITPNATVVTLPATDITDHTVILHGSVNAHGCPTKLGGTWSFVVGKTTLYGTAGPLGSYPMNSKDDTLVQGKMYGLDANTTYHFQLTAFSSCGAGNATDLTFSTLPQVNPNISVTTLSATSITDHSAQISGSISPYGCMSPAGGGSWSTLYGSSSLYGKKGPAGVFDSHSNGVITKGGVIDNLSPNTTYHFAMTAADGCGAEFGKDVTFTTQPSSFMPMLVLGGLGLLGGLAFLALKMGWLKV